MPDASGFTSNIYRFLFTPDATGGTITPTGILAGVGSKKGAKIETVALPQGPSNDGALYIGYSDAGSIEKITNPATAPAAAIGVGKLFNSTGVISMAFQGNDLYLVRTWPATH